MECWMLFKIFYVRFVLDNCIEQFFDQFGKYGDQFEECIGQVVKGNNFDQWI